MFYIVWVISLYGIDRNERWAHEVGPVTSMCFSLRGISVAVIFFLTQPYESRERKFVQQVNDAQCYTIGFVCCCWMNV